MIKLFGILGVGIVLRALSLNHHDFWFDEAFTYHIARLPILDLFKAVLTDNNPPLYYLLIHFLLKLSSNEIILRFPSLIASIASIVLLYTMLKKFISRKAGLIVSALFAVSPLAIYIGTEARLHSLAMLMAVMLVSLFLKLIKKRKPLIIALFILTASLGLYAQYYIALLFLPFTWIVLRYKTSLTLKTWAIIAGTAIFLLLPWLYLSMLTGHNGCSCPSTLLSLPSVLVSPILGGVGEVTIRAFPSLPLPILLLFGVTALITLFLFLKGFAQNRSITLLYLIPLGIISFLGLFFPVFSPKAFAIFSPFYFTIVAIGVTSYRRSSLITLLLIGLMGTISIIQIANPFFAGTRLKPIDAIIKNSRSVPVAHTSLLTYYSLNYYSQGNQKHILITQNPLSVETLRFIRGQKQEVDKNVSDLWLVDTEKWVDKKSRKTALDRIFKNYEIKKKDRIDIISVYLLKKK